MNQCVEKFIGERLIGAIESTIEGKVILKFESGELHVGAVGNDSGPFSLPSIQLWEVMNPQDKACRSQTGPDCKYRTSAIRSLLTGVNCRLEPFFLDSGSVSDCPCYSPKSTTILDRLLRGLR